MTDFIEYKGHKIPTKLYNTKWEVLPQFHQDDTQTISLDCSKLNDMIGIIHKKEVQLRRDNIDFKNLYLDVTGNVESDWKDAYVEVELVWEVAESEEESKARIDEAKKKIDSEVEKIDKLKAQMEKSIENEILHLRSLGYKVTK